MLCTHRATADGSDGSADGNNSGQQQRSAVSHGDGALS
jgi:hypothetical protein